MRVYWITEDVTWPAKQMAPLRMYLAEQNRRIRRVLDEVGYPAFLHFYITDKIVPFEDFLLQRIWLEGLEGYAAGLESRQQYGQAARIYRLLITAARQCRSEQHQPLGLERMMQDKLETLPEG